jgi:hypothetical protein
MRVHRAKGIVRAVKGVRRVGEVVCGMFGGEGGVGLCGWRWRWVWVRTFLPRQKVGVEGV